MFAGRFEAVCLKACGLVLTHGVHPNMESVKPKALRSMSRVFSVHSDRRNKWTPCWNSGGTMERRGKRLSRFIHGWQDGWPRIQSCRIDAVRAVCIVRCSILVVFVFTNPAKYVSLRPVWMQLPVAGVAFDPSAAAGYDVQRPCALPGACHDCGSTSRRAIYGN